MSEAELLHSWLSNVRTKSHSFRSREHVIRKFLEANRLKNLTEYLEALHRRNMQATTDHTTLLLTCYTQQQNVKRLRAFIGYQEDDGRAQKTVIHPLI